MLRDDKLNHVYNRFQELDSDKLAIRNKIINDSSYTQAQYNEDRDILHAKKEYLEERLKLLLGINATLKELKKHPEKSSTFKYTEDPTQWEVFEKNLKVYQWLPFDGEICDFCGRTQTTTTAIAAAVLPTGELDIICSRCFTDKLKTQTSKYGDVSATS